jgi:signal peptidase I
MKETMMKEKKTAKQENELLEWVKAIVIAIVIAMIVRTFLFETIEVPQFSMYDTFDEGDRVIIGKMLYRIEEPSYGQIIVFQTDEMAFPYIKRVIGVEGDTVAITNGTLILNGEPIEEAYLYEPMVYD